MKCTKCGSLDVVAVWGDPNVVRLMCMSCKAFNLINKDTAYMNYSSLLKADETKESTNEDVLLRHLVGI